MPSIIFFDQFGNIGGGQRVLLDLCEYLQKHDWSVTVACPVGEVQNILQKKGVEVFTINEPKMQNGRKDMKDIFVFAKSWFYPELPQQEWKEYDLIVVNGMRMLPMARALQRKTDAPMVLYLHLLFTGIQRIIVKHALRSSNVWGLSPSKAIGAFDKKIKTISHGVNTEFMSAGIDTASMRTELHIDDDLPIVLVPGRLSKDKGQQEVLEALKKIKTRNFHTVFAGDAHFGTTNDQTKSKILEAAKSDHLIHLVCKPSSMVSLYDVADLVIIPSQWEEPFGLTCIEAMARGKPLIVSKRGELPILVRHGDFANIIEPNPDAIAMHIQNFFEHTDQWLQKAQKAKEYARSHFDPDAQWGTIADYFQNILDDRR